MTTATPTFVREVFFSISTTNRQDRNIRQLDTPAFMTSSGATSETTFDAWMEWDVDEHHSETRSRNRYTGQFEETVFSYPIR